MKNEEKIDGIDDTNQVDVYLKYIVQLLLVIIILEVLFNWDKLLLFRDWLIDLV